MKHTQVCCRNVFRFIDITTIKTKIEHILASDSQDEEVLTYLHIVVSFCIV